MIPLRSTKNLRRRWSPKRPKLVAFLFGIAVAVTCAQPARSAEAQDEDTAPSEPVTEEQIAELEKITALDDEYGDVPDDAPTYELAARVWRLEREAKQSARTASELRERTYPDLSKEDAERERTLAMIYVEHESEKAERARKDLRPLAKRLEPYGGSKRVLAAYFHRKLARDAETLLRAARTGDSVLAGEARIHLRIAQLTAARAGGERATALEEKMAVRIEQSRGAPPAGVRYELYRTLALDPRVEMGSDR